MDEPPKKRARRTDSAAMWDNEQSDKPTSKDRGSVVAAGSDYVKPAGQHRHEKKSREEPRNGDSSKARKHGNDRRRKSRSLSPRTERIPDRHEDRGSERTKDERRRSRSPHKGADRERGYRERERARERDGDRERTWHGNDRDKERSRSRDRKQGRGRDVRGGREVERKRSRSRSPTRASAPTARNQHRLADGKNESKPLISNGTSRSKKQGSVATPMDVDGDDVDAFLRQSMGFSSFKSTHNTKVPGNQIYGVRKEKVTEYRQYMNRTGGFNRPLSPGR